jgi:hypothetical protein
MTCFSKSPSLFLCLLLACTPSPYGCSGQEATDGGETADEETADGLPDTSADSCMPTSAVELTITDDDASNDELVQIAPCTVTSAEQDPNDATRWTFALDCLTEVTVELVTDPPLDELPFAIGEELQGHISDGASFQMVELEGAAGPLMALLYTSGPTGMVDQPTFGGPFEFEWSPAADCTTTDAECGAVNQLQLDASAGGEALSLAPEQRYGELIGAAPDERYGLWIGDSWTSDCGGEQSETLRYAVVALP